MAISQLEKDTMAKAFAVSKQVLQDLHAKLQALNEIYNSVGGVKATLTQEEMNGVPELSGLTKTQLDDGVYALTATLLPSITSGYTALAQLASRYL